MLGFRFDVTCSRDGFSDDTPETDVPELNSPVHALHGERCTVRAVAYRIPIRGEASMVLLQSDGRTFISEVRKLFLDID